MGAVGLAISRYEKIVQNLYLFHVICHDMLFDYTIWGYFILRKNDQRICRIDLYAFVDDKRFCQRHNYYREKRSRDKTRQYVETGCLFATQFKREIIV